MTETTMNIEGPEIELFPVPPDVPVIHLVQGPVDEIAAEAEEALMIMDVPIYQFGSQLVFPIAEEVDAAKGRRTYIARFKAMTEVTMVAQLSKVTMWEKTVRVRNGFERVRINPSTAIAKTILQREGDWKFSKVAGISTCPTLRPDGTVVSEPGYDPVTRLVLIEPLLLPAMPTTPKCEDAKVALQLLIDLLDGFPFVDDASQSVALSAIITLVVRGAMNVVPMHAVTAPAAGTGKSYLFDIAAAIVTGQHCPVIAIGDTVAETEKRLDAVLMTGQSLVCLDNVNGQLKSDALCQTISQPRKKVRVLGQSKMVDIDHRSTIFCNGNNLRLVGDVVRRAIRCQMDAGLEQPETRTFASDPLAQVMADRARYIAAALTIVRAYILAGRPGLGDLPKLNGFEEWSASVRGALVWLGQADPVATVEASRADDDELMAISEALTAMQGAYLEWPLMSGELYRLATARSETAGDTTKPPGDATKPPLMRVELYRALKAAVGDKDFTSGTLAQLLASIKDKIVDGLKVDRSYDTHKKQWLWRLMRFDVKEGEWSMVDAKTDPM